MTYYVKILVSDCLRAMPFKWNIAKKSVTRVQIATKISKVGPKKPGEP